MFLFFVFGMQWMDPLGLGADVTKYFFGRYTDKVKIHAWQSHTNCRHLQAWAMHTLWISEDICLQIPHCFEWSSRIHPGICQQIIHTHKSPDCDWKSRHTLSQLLNNEIQSPSEAHSAGHSLLQHFSGKNHQRVPKTLSLDRSTDVYLSPHSGFIQILLPSFLCFVFTQLRLFGCSSGLVLHVCFIFRILQGLERNLTPHSHRTVTWLSQINRQAWDG